MIRIPPDREELWDEAGSPEVQTAPRYPFGERSYADVSNATLTDCS
jgi:hypothetical protein